MFDKALTRTSALALVLLCIVGTLGQAKKSGKASGQVEKTRVWHRYVNKDEIEGDQVVYYLLSVEDDKVLLLVHCKGGKVNAASLHFPFRLYGASESTLKYKSATGEVKELDLGLTDGSDGMVTTRPEDLKSLAGSTFRVEDASGNMRTFHLPSAGSAPFDTGCETGNP